MSDASPRRRTPRQLAREANIARIKELALEQLAREGASGLSLRAVARELNLVSSAIYRYYASRDDLVTALVLDAYADLADAVEGAQGGEAGRDAWVRGCAALRTWACAEPHRYALIYGSPIPGYAAPQDTVEPAARVMRLLVTPAVGVVPATGRAGGGVIDPRLRTQLDEAVMGLRLTERTGADELLGLVGAVARVHGLVQLELNGQFAGGFEPADLLFEALLADEADRLGLA